MTLQFSASTIQVASAEDLRLEVRLIDRDGGPVALPSGGSWAWRLQAAGYADVTFPATGRTISATAGITNGLSIVGLYANINAVMPLGVIFSGDLVLTSASGSLETFAVIQAARMQTPQNESDLGQRRVLIRRAGGQTINISVGGISAEWLDQTKEARDDAIEASVNASASAALLGPTPQSKGCVGDGSVDDSSALITWLQYCYDNGYIADGLSYFGFVYLVTSARVLNNIVRKFKVRNLVVKESGALATAAIILTLKGSGVSSTISIAAAARGDSSITLAANGTVNIGDVIEITSSDLWHDNSITGLTGTSNVNVAEYVIATSAATLSGQTVTIDRQLKYDYVTSPQALITAMAEEIWAENVRCISSAANKGHYGLQIENAKNVIGNNIVGEKCGGSGLNIRSFMKASSDQSGATGGWYTGGTVNYGVQGIGPGNHIDIYDPFLEGGRHITAFGGTKLIGKAHVRGGAGTNLKEAAFDAHAGVDEFVIEGGSSDVEATTARGVSSHARRTFINVPHLNGPAFGIRCTIACCLYESSITIDAGYIETSDTSIDIIQASRKPFKASIRSKAESTTGAALLVRQAIASGTPGDCEFLQISGRYKGDTYGAYAYASGGMKILTILVGDESEFIVPDGVSGKFPLYLRGASDGDVDIAQVFGVMRGGQYPLYMLNVLNARGMIIEKGATNNVIFNNQDADIDAATRFKIDVLNAV